MRIIFTPTVNDTVYNGSHPIYGKIHIINSGEQEVDDALGAFLLKSRPDIFTLPENTKVSTPKTEKQPKKTPTKLTPK